MALHTQHEGEAILYDGCPRCTEHADSPFDDLDDSHFDRLVKKIEEKQDTWVTCTENEYVAIQNIKRVMERHSRIAQAKERLARIL